MKAGFGTFALLLVATLAAGYLGSFFPPGEWYAALAKPSWTPPGWVFGPVWALLYALMAIAAWLVWRRAGLAGAKGALALYVFQLLLNALWSFLFFKLHLMVVSVVEVVLLWLAILATARAFGRITRSAGLLLIPYLAWVGYAAALHLAMWRLNR